MLPNTTPTLSRFRRVWPAYCILGVILLLTLVAARNGALVGQEKTRAGFEREVQQTHAEFQRMINGNLILLDGMRGLANAKLTMTKGQFHSYVDALQLRENYPGAQGLGFVFRVLQDRKATDVEKIRVQGLPTFHIWPESQRAEMYPVVYLAPEDSRNEAEIGYDLSSETAPRAALELATATGHVTASGRFTFAQPPSGREQAGFLLITPLYLGRTLPETRELRSQQLMGVLFCLFRLDDLFKVFSDARLNPQLAFKVYDGTELDAGHLLYESAPALSSQSSALTSTRTLAVADRTWTVVFSRKPEAADGSPRFLNPFIAITGTMIGFLLFGMMLTQARARAAAEAHAETQRSTEARYRRLVEQSIVGIYVIQKDRFVYVNPKMLEIFGCSREEELTSQPLLDFIAEESRETTQENVEKRLRGDVESVHYELRGLRRDGKVIDLEAHGGRVEYNGQPAILGSLIDITARKQIEAELERQRTELQIVLDAVPALIFYKDAEHRLARVNEEAVRVAGLPREALEGKTDKELGREHAEHYYRDEDEVMASGEAKRGIIEPLETSRGTRWLQTDKIPYRDGTGRIVGVIGFALDITERRQAEKRVQAQLRRLDLLSRTTRAIGERQDLQSIFQVVVGSLEEHLPVDFSCVCLYDGAAEALTVACIGARSADVAAELGITDQTSIVTDRNGLSRCLFGQVVYEPDLAKIEFPFPQRLLRGGLRSLVAAPMLVESKVFGILIVARRQTESFSSGECEFLRQLSEHVALAANQAQLYSALQQAYDDLRQTQQAVMQQERLRALGQMASGIAHDINNAISPVMLYTESLLETEPNLSARTRECLETIQQSVHDVAETVTRLREFSRPRESELTFVPVQLNRLVPQVVDLTRARWSDLPQQRGIVINMVTELATELPIVMGVESEIREALINLIFNAADAMPTGGTLTLRTGATDEAARQGEVSRHAHVEVSDTGAGMDEDTRRRCLEPFFTTKGERGTGLGLAMVYGTVQRHGGDIQIESAIGKGTTMRLRFPVPAAPSLEPVRSSASLQPRPNLRILVVDDDPLVLQSLRQILEFEGHRVVSANDGQLGLDAFHEAQGGAQPFDVVITDLGMPHVDGRQVASGVKSVSPSTPVILHTGWGQRLLAEGDVPPHVDHVLSKPPKLRELREALARSCPPAGS